ncbi:hypothetical protein SVAN01_10659 [Stagonosporopsis vannaccii]|nr:hypothetical protein SVAN01_10659 [Stagonosporopsis vannaccii]
MEQVAAEASDVPQRGQTCEQTTSAAAVDLLPQSEAKPTQEPVRGGGQQRQFQSPPNAAKHHVRSALIARGVAVLPLRRNTGIRGCAARSSVADSHLRSTLLTMVKAYLQASSSPREPRAYRPFTGQL